jgi:radical SAM superfamily enzyme YgiQ (UPF0313 family)
VQRKICIVQPSYRDRGGRLIRAGPPLFTNSLAVPALSAALPPEWRKECRLEYYEDVDLETDAPVVGITCLGYDLFRGRELAIEFRRRGKVVLFGGNASELWKDVIGDVADSIVSGNPGRGELASILADAEAGRLAREYRCGTDLDYPFDYSVLARRHVASRIACMPALTSAGCPNRCEFCCTAARYDGRHFLRSHDAVMADLHVLRTLGRRFVFVDSNFYVDREHVLGIAERIITEGIGLAWSAEATIDIGDDAEALALIRRAGCRALLIGFETVSQRNLNHTRKPFAVARYREQVRNIQRAGIAVAGFFIFGFDNDDRSTIGELCDFVRDTGIALAIVNFLCPVPGTRLHERMAAAGRLLSSGGDAYLQQTSVYSSPTHRCLFQPARMSPREAELAFIELLGRISAWPAMLRRCIRLGPVAGVPALYMNLTTRRAARAVARALHD